MRAYELDSLISESARLFCLFSQPKRLINAMNSQLSTEIRSPHSRRKRKSRNPGVLEVLLESRFFRILTGKIPLTALFRSGADEGNRGIVRTKNQSPLAIFIDVVIFAILCLLAPFYTVYKYIHVWVRERWWIKFTLGVATGILSVCLVLFVLQILYGLKLV